MDLRNIAARIQSCRHRSEEIVLIWLLPLEFHGVDILFDLELDAIVSEVVDL